MHPTWTLWNLFGMTKVAIASAISLLLWVGLSAQTNVVESITIHSSWGGLGVPRKDNLKITARSDGSYRGAKQANRSTISELIDLLETDPIGAPTLQNIGLTEEWLAANATRGMDQYAGAYFSVAAQNQKELYLRSFSDVNLVEELLPRILRGGWTDDYPTLKVEIEFRDGRRATLETISQTPLMLPWKVLRDGESKTTYDARISRAVAALMPNDFENRDRVAGTRLSRDLARSVMRAIENDWKFLGAENKAGSAINRLREKYKVESLDINGTHGVDHGMEWVNGNSQETNLFAVLSSKKYPAGFFIRIILPFANQRVNNLEHFEEKIDQYFLTVQKASWFSKLIGDGRAPAWLRFIKDRSFSEKAMHQFSADMKILGRESLIAEVEKVQREIALISLGGGLDYYQSYWLVLPDQRVILWRYGSSPILPVSIERSNSKQCKGYDSGIVKCVGVAFSKDGGLLP
jgi:hypothetical protein